MELELVATFTSNCSCGWRGDTVFTRDGAHRLYMIHVEHKHPARYAKMTKKTTFKTETWED